MVRVRGEGLVFGIVLNSGGGSDQKGGERGGRTQRGKRKHRALR